MGDPKIVQASSWLKKGNSLFWDALGYASKEI